MANEYDVTDAALAKELRDKVSREGIHGLDEYITNNLDKWKSVKIKVAITGNSGAGKSSLINAMRGINPSDKKAAREGITETTQEKTSYSFPDNDQIVLYDIPGVGTRKHRSGSYLKEMDFKQYDFVIIVSAQRFTENDEMIIKGLHSMNIRFYLVRSKIMQEVENQKETQTRDEVLDTIRKDCLLNLEDLGIKAKDIFLVDSHLHKDFELGKLQMNLVKDAPSILKTSLILTFKCLSKEVIEAKVKVLKNRAKWVAIKALVSAVPGAQYAMDVNVIKNEISFYKKELGLDDESLGASQDILQDLQEAKDILASINRIDSQEKVLQYWSALRSGLDLKRLGLKMLLEGMEYTLKGCIYTYPKVYSTFLGILDSLEKVSIELSANILDKIQGSSFV